MGRKRVEQELSLLIRDGAKLPARIAVVVGRPSRSQRSRYRAVFVVPGKGGKAVVLADIRLEQN